MSTESKLPQPQENVQPKDYKAAFKGQEASKFVDPCAAAAKASLKCMDLNDYDRDKCMDYFEAYRDCKAAWLEKRKDDRRNGRSD
uniref:CHCH domain-containing protein n=1 Tax=Mycena chlorophos TaxID=658473 RepID=A0ABQ0L6H2_MYCCL|nr:predicted protein [Mycena chlorophos]